MIHDIKLSILSSLLLAGGLWVGHDHYANQVARYDELRGELERSFTRAARIEQLRKQPDRVMRHSQTRRAMAERIERSASESGIPASQIVRIDPQAARRAEDTPYMEHATLVQLEEVTLRQLAKLASRFHSGDASFQNLHITSLRITAPYRTAGARGGTEKKTTQNNNLESWNMELTLTWFVYSPKNSEPKRAKSKQLSLSQKSA